LSVFYLGLYLLLSLIVGFYFILILISITRARGLSLREDGKPPLSPLSTQPLMVGLLHNASLYLLLPLLETLGCRRVGERTFEREDCGIHPWMPLLSLRRPYFLPRPGNI